ncbi:hypothetical protein A2635_04175 [Candidatus Peribacteria bacterium RIFCSPHIGHO2_01_FULL_51_9]|nr:MAG: hypothetical protein A2635_04175 [Candidatus Peribacteria bacterium RIFCSPHIGHO2_01_FULL_51_9]
MKDIAPKIAERKMKAKIILIKLKKLLPHAGMILRYSNGWECLVSVILSAQCTDKKVNEVTAKLFKKYQKLDDYLRAKPKEFEKDIYSTGFYKNKTKNILAAAKVIKEEFHGRIPKTMAEMLTIPGVARKTANVVLGNVHGIVEGIAVDTHVKRLAFRFGLTDEEIPEKVERDLMALIPKKDWFKSTYLFIEYGRKFCPAKRHDHMRCPLRGFDRK